MEIPPAGNRGILKDPGALEQGPQIHPVKDLSAHDFPIPVKTRAISGGLRLRIPKDVFHPGFFRSTKILLKYIDGLPIAGKRFLELGAGSGLISFAAAKKGAVVTATDINAQAVKYLGENSRANRLALEIIHSDLFTDIPHCRFDIVAINPPYYKKDPEFPGRACLVLRHGGAVFPEAV